MKTSKILTATFLSAAIAGLTLPACATQAPAAPSAGHVATHQAATRHPAQPAHAARHPAHGKQHKWVSVHAGETLAGIASRQHMTWQAIYATPPNYRHLANPGLLAVGMRLRIPDKPAMRAAEFAAKFASMPPAVTGPATSGRAPVTQAPSSQTPASPSQQYQAPQYQAPQYQAPGTQPTAPSTPASGSPSSFQKCVAWRESSNNPTASSAGLYGILPSTWSSLGYSGTAGQASVATQNAAFQRLYAQDGSSPWSAYDGCQP